MGTGPSQDRSGRVYCAGCDALAAREPAGSMQIDGEDHPIPDSDLQPESKKPRLDVDGMLVCLMGRLVIAADGSISTHADVLFLSLLQMRTNLGLSLRYTFMHL